MNALSIRQLYKRYGGLVVTDHLNLDIAAGSLHAIIGPNGAGKTSLIQQISGALASDSGQILLHGQDISQFSMPERVAAGLARSYQITSIFKHYSVADNLILALQAQHYRYTGFFKFWPAPGADQQLYQAARQLAKKIGLHDQFEDQAGILAHGQQRQLEFGLSLATGASVLLLDEPMAGMGKENSGQLIELLASLRGEITMILVEHDIDAVFELADTISVLVAGRIIASGKAETIRHHPEVKLAYLGEQFDTA